MEMSMSTFAIRTFPKTLLETEVTWNYVDALGNEWEKDVYSNSETSSVTHP